MIEQRLVHLVDDEESIRRSVVFLLKTSGFAVQTWDSGVTFLQRARSVAPGCVLLDIRMPDMDGLTVQRSLATRGLALPVIVLTGHGDVASAVAAMRAGAVDFIEKPFEKAALLRALELGFQRLSQSMVESTTAREADVRIAALTPRERDVLQGLARGHPNKTIAYDLGISPRTVEVHRANVMAKLGVHSLSDALRIAFASRLGRQVVDPPPAIAAEQMPLPNGT